jgi:hypothetical protein
MLDSVYRRSTLTAGARWFLSSEDVGPKVVDLPFFSDFIDGRRRVLVQDSTGISPIDVPQRHVASCVNRHVHRLTKPQ